MCEREREMLLTHLLCCTILCSGSKPCLNKISQTKKKTDKIPTTEETVISCFTVNQFQNNFKIIHIFMFPSLNIVNYFILFFKKAVNLSVNFKFMFFPIFVRCESKTNNLRQFSNYSFRTNTKNIV